jgi:hypothetical protein
MFNFAHPWVNIVLTKDGIWIWTLTNVVIANPMHADLVPNLAQLKDLLP